MSAPSGLRDDALADVAGHLAQAVAVGVRAMRAADPQPDGEHEEHRQDDENRTGTTKQKLKLRIHGPSFDNRPEHPPTAGSGRP